MANLEPNEAAEVGNEPEILVNDYGTTKDSTVVVEEENRTVLLTGDETIIIEKEPRIDIVPKNRARRIYAGMWGSAETAAVGLGMLAVLAVIILVVLVVFPARKELEKNKAERDRLETELLSARGKYGSITTTEARVAQLTNSVDDFENRFLLSPINGKTAIYQRINGLISAYGLVNSTGPDYTPLEISAGQQRRGQDAEAERGRAKFQSLFPGVYVTMTVQGSYQNLRRFVRDIETSDQFVVISAVEFQPAENEEKGKTTNGATQQASINGARIAPQTQSDFDSLYNVGTPNQSGSMMQQQPPPMTVQAQTAPITTAKPPAARGKTHGETVSLHLEMAAYFRRPNVSQTAVDAQ